MEFKFAVNDIFKQPFVEINQNLIPPGFSGDRRALWDTVGKVSEIINAMGEASAAAQGLTKPITTADRLRNSDHKIYLLIDQNAGNGRGAVTGMLKTGKKGLYVFDRNGQHFQVSPPCVLDFYVHESCQRMGLGKRLFEHMLQNEEIHPVKMAIDRPSDKFLGFLTKHYGLKDPVKQMNNFVVFDEFFPSSPERNGNTVEVNNSSVAGTPGKKLSANGLQAYASPMGRYGAPRPHCSMGQIIHNQTSTIQKNPEPAGNQANMSQSMPNVPYYSAEPNYSQYQWQQQQQQPITEQQEPSQHNQIPYQNNQSQLALNTSPQNLYPINPTTGLQPNEQSLLSGSQMVTNVQSGNVGIYAQQPANNFVVQQPGMFTGTDSTMGYSNNVPANLNNTNNNMVSNTNLPQQQYNSQQGYQQQQQQQGLWMPSPSQQQIPSQFQGTSPNLMDYNNNNSNWSNFQPNNVVGVEGNNMALPVTQQVVNNQEPLLPAPVVQQQNNNSAQVFNQLLPNRNASAAAVIQAQQNNALVPPPSNPQMHQQMIGNDYNTIPPATDPSILYQQQQQQPQNINQQYNDMLATLPSNTQNNVNQQQNVTTLLTAQNNNNNNMMTTMMTGNPAQNYSLGNIPPAYYPTNNASNMIVPQQQQQESVVQQGINVAPQNNLANQSNSAMLVPQQSRYGLQQQEMMPAMGSMAGFNSFAAPPQSFTNASQTQFNMPPVVVVPPSAPQQNTSYVPSVQNVNQQFLNQPTRSLSPVQSQQYANNNNYDNETAKQQQQQQLQAVSQSNILHHHEYVPGIMENASKSNMAGDNKAYNNRLNSSGMDDQRQSQSSRSPSVYHLTDKNATNGVSDSRNARGDVQMLIEETAAAGFSSPKLERPRSLSIQPNEDQEALNENILLGDVEENELLQIIEQSAAAEATKKIKKEDDLEEQIEKLSVSATQKEPPRKIQSNIIFGDTHDDDADKSPGKKTPSHLTEQGFYDLKFYHSKLW